MKDIVERLRDVNEDSLVMQVVRDCMDAAEEIEVLRGERETLKQSLREIKESIVAAEKKS